MLKVDVLTHFGSQRAAAKALGISIAAVSGWGDVVPEGSAYKLQVITGGVLRVDPALYADRPKRGQVARRGAA
jgi:transcriptional repressor of cell division inhibition gene dicB